MEDWERVLALEQPTGGQNHRDKVGACVLEQRQRRRTSEKLQQGQEKCCQALWCAYLDICCRDIADHVQMIVHHDNRGHALIVHHLKSLTEWFVAARRRPRMSGPIQATSL